MSAGIRSTLFVVYGPAARLTRNEALKLIWRHTHRDFKGTKGGTRTILMARSRRLVPLAELSTVEIARKLDACWQAEQRRIAKPPRRVRDTRAPMDIFEVRGAKR